MELCDSRSVKGYYWYRICLLLLSDLEDFGREMVKNLEKYLILLDKYFWIVYYLNRLKYILRGLVFVKYINYGIFLVRVFRWGYG